MDPNFRPLDIAVRTITVIPPVLIVSVICYLNTTWLGIENAADIQR